MFPLKFVIYEVYHACAGKQKEKGKKAGADFRGAFSLTKTLPSAILNSEKESISSNMKCLSKKLRFVSYYINNTVQ